MTTQKKEWLATPENMAELRAMRNEELDSLRVELPSMSTSAIVSTMINPDAVLDAIADSVPISSKMGATEYREAADLQDKLAAAVTLALCDELDARIPPRKLAPAEQDEVEQMARELTGGSKVP